jgi:cell division protein FtsZ
LVKTGVGWTLDSSDIIGPVLLVGIGGFGKKIALEAKRITGYECVIVSDDKRDIDDSTSFYIDCKPWINPSVFRIRSFMKLYEAKISSVFSKFKTVIIISNLGGKTGAAISPFLSSIAKSCLNKLISFVVMPFRFEKERLFYSATCFRRLNFTSDAVFVLDNDAFLEINPDLSLEECYSMTNSALINIIKLMPSVKMSRGEGIICMNGTKESDAEKALRDSIAMLYSSSEPESVGKSFLYISKKSKFSIGNLNTLAEKLRKFQSINSLAEVDLHTSGNFNGTVNLVSTVETATKFDSYDPLAIIPSESCLDWEVPDSHPEIELPLPNIE